MMKKIVMGMGAAVVLATMAQADAFTDSVLADLQSKGFQVMEVKTEGSRLKVEAAQGSTRLEVVYDTGTGKIVRQEMYPLSAGGTGSGADGGVSDTDGMHDRAGSGEGRGHGSDDGMGHDTHDDHGGSTGAGHDDNGGHDDMGGHDDKGGHDDNGGHDDKGGHDDNGGHDRDGGHDDHADGRD